MLAAVTRASGSFLQSSAVQRTDCGKQAGRIRGRGKGRESDGLTPDTCEADSLGRRDEQPEELTAVEARKKKKKNKQSECKEK